MRTTAFAAALLLAAGWLAVSAAEDAAPARPQSDILRAAEEAVKQFTTSAKSAQPPAGAEQQNQMLKAAEEAVKQFSGAESAAPAPAAGAVEEAGPAASAQPSPAEEAPPSAGAAPAPEEQNQVLKAAEEAGSATSAPPPAQPSPADEAPAQQDDVLKAIDEAVHQYRTDDLAGAVSNLDYAGQLIRQKKSERMKTLLPEALPGWQANAATAQTLGAAVFGGGATVRRDYFTGNGAVVSVEIVSDSPVLQSVIMMLNNPLFAVGSLQTVKDQRAMIRYDAKERSGEVNVVAAGRFIITVKGRLIDQPVLLHYAEAVDFEALAKN